MHRPHLIFVLCLCLLVQSALAGFSDELWYTFVPTTQPTTQAAIPDGWRATIWTNGPINASTPADDIKAVAHLCRYGGAANKMPAQIYGYLKFYKRLDSERITPGTLIVADSEGAPDANGYPAALATAIRSQTKKYVLYPGVLSAGTIATDFSFGWTAQLREVDLFAMSRLVKRAAPYIALSGDYVLLEMYLSDKPASQEQQFRSWSLMLSALRGACPDKKILALVRGDYVGTDTDPLSADERHRLARFVTIGIGDRRAFDGALAFGYARAAVPLMEDISALANDGLTLFDGEKWGRE